MSDFSENNSAIEQLFQLLKPQDDIDEEALKPENLRYVLYTRKSTIDESRQEKSKTEQRDECLERVVKPLNIKLLESDIIREDGSAKEPDIRPLFRKMLDDIKAGRYDGIIAWHPDRLARNMKEAGEIIDMLDKGILRDLQFATSTFENSPTGKMLLGISFVLSKQYSEHLSETVMRGNKHKTNSGKFLRSFLHGYIKTEDGKLYPDGANFSIIKEAFAMRVRGESQAELVRYLNGRKDYQVFKYKQGGHFDYHWDKDSVSKILSDPTFAGIIRYSGGIANLIELYDFEPAVTAEDFLMINKAKGFMSPRFKSSITSPKEGAQADLLRGLVYCDDCNKSLSSGITTKRNANYYRYRCETDGCKMKNKGPRAKIITDYAIDYLDEYRFTTKSNYENYAVEVAASRKAKLGELTRLMASLDKQILKKKRSYDHAKKIVADEDNPLRQHYVNDLDNYRSEITKLKKAHRLAKAEYKNLKTAVPTYKKYLELFDNAADLLRSTSSIVLMDKILRKFFSNITVKGELYGPKMVNTRWKVKSSKLKEPYAGFLQSKDFEYGRGSRT